MKNNNQNEFGAASVAGAVIITVVAIFLMQRLGML